MLLVQLLVLVLVRAYRDMALMRLRRQVAMATARPLLPGPAGCSLLLARATAVGTAAWGPCARLALPRVPALAVLPVLLLLPRHLLQRCRGLAARQADGLLLPCSAVYSTSLLTVLGLAAWLLGKQLVVAAQALVAQLRVLQTGLCVVAMCLMACA